MSKKYVKKIMRKITSTHEADIHDLDFVPTAQFTTAGREPKLQLLALSK